MAVVPSSFAEWLRSPELVEIAASSAVKAAWGELAYDGGGSSPFALRADAAGEGTRQLAFYGAPLAVETVELTGRHAALVGTSRRIRGDVEEYAAGPAVFVIGADEREGGTTLLTVLRKVEVA